MERNPTSAIHFRTKLLSAACQMQSALCITDLGQLFHKPLKDSQGTVVLSTVNCVKVSHLRMLESFSNFKFNCHPFRVLRQSPCWILAGYHWTKFTRNWMFCMKRTPSTRSCWIQYRSKSLIIRFQQLSYRRACIWVIWRCKVPLIWYRLWCRQRRQMSCHIVKYVIILIYQREYPS